MTAISAWRGAFIERLRATGNVTLAARGAGVSRQDMRRLIVATRGKVFTFATLDQLVQSTRLREFASS